MNTTLYIDGFNLYYGRLKNTPYKWLDVNELFLKHIIHTQTPKAILTSIKYFTADIKAKLASRGQVANDSQQRYLRALSQYYPNSLEIIKGYYSIEKTTLPIYKIPPDKQDRVAVWKLEEKQTDVNIALNMFNDVVQKCVEQLVLVSNDTDLEPALSMIRSLMGNNIKIGIVIPISHSTDKNRRPPNQRLSKYADWTRTYITDQELADSQLPEMIATDRKPIRKPDYW